MGRGNNKRKAKQEAANALLALLGITISDNQNSASTSSSSINCKPLTTCQPQKSSLKSSISNTSADLPVGNCSTFAELAGKSKEKLQRTESDVKKVTFEDS